MGRIYGKVDRVEDISRINCIIRDEMLQVKSEAELVDLKKRSDYLCTLTYSPFWKKKFGDKIEELRKVALEENRVTARLANGVAKYLGFNKEFHPWGKDKHQVEDELKEIPERVVEEFVNNVISLEPSSLILGEIRKFFCDLRKAAIVCEDVKCLDRVKRLMDIVSTLPYLPSFSQHFDDDLMKKIDELINKEKQRTIKLLNIISSVRDFGAYYDILDTMEEQTAHYFLEEIEEEEKKADTYIPTEAKYKGGGKVLWLVYYHPGRKREYAKRIYFPAVYRNLSVDGPSVFYNRFGNPVYGIKISYEVQVKPTVIRVRGKEIHLPERWIRREKIVSVPEVAENIRITEERPESAMNIA